MRLHGTRILVAAEKSTPREDNPDPRVCARRSAAEAAYHRPYEDLQVTNGVSAQYPLVPLHDGARPMVLFWACGSRKSFPGESSRGRAC
jgi:hypothetical protein